jgi:tetratricopeptide (TPR) repeat protein
VKPLFKLVAAISLCLLSLSARGQIYDYRLVPKDLSSAFENGTKQIGQKNYDAGFKSLDQGLVLLWTYRILDLPAYSAELIRLCEKSQPDPKTEQKLLNYSVYFAPHSSEMAFARARYFFTLSHFSLKNSRAEFDHGIKLLDFDFLCQYRIKAEFWILLARFLEGAVIAFSILIVFRYYRALFHRLGHLLPEPLKKAFIPFLIFAGLLPVFFAAPLWAVLVWPGVLCLPFAKRTLQALFLVLLLVFCLSGSFMAHGQKYLLPLSKNPIVSEYHMSIGLPDSEDLSMLRSRVEKSPTPAAVLGLADAERRVGDHKKSSELLTGLVDNPEALVFANNQLAELYLESGQTAEATQLIAQSVACLEKAAGATPQFAEVYYNLSQLYNIQRQFDKSDSAYQKARQLDPDAVERFELVKKLANSSVVIARLPIPGSLIEKERDWVSSTTKIGSTKVINIAQIAFFAVALLLVIVIGLSNKTKVCFYCGRIICPECLPESRESGVCAPCYQVFRSGKAVDPKLKGEQKALVRSYHRLMGVVGLSLSVLFPGSGLLLEEKIILGATIMIWPVCFWTLALSGAAAPESLVPVFSVWPLWAWLGLMGYAVMSAVSALLYFVLARVEG